MATDLLFSFDTTGSMYPCLTQVRQNVAALTRSMFETVPDLRIAIITHGDYCDGAKVITLMDFSSSAEEVCKFIQGAPATGGGDAPECYELALKRGRQLSWCAGATKVFTLIGDDVPHGPSYPGNVEKIDWRNELALLLEAGINVYAVQALSRGHATSFYQEVAKTTGGFHLTLEQFRDVSAILHAVCVKQNGAEGLAAFEKHLQDSGAYNDAIGENFDRLMGRPVRERAKSYTHTSGGGSSTPKAKAGDKTLSFSTEKLTPVHPSRFQVLDIPKDCTITDYVRDQGLTFKKGRGFYEFTKPVTVQPYKEVVLVQMSTGMMFTGAEARKILGLPTGATVNVSPEAIPGFKAFIQSTSSNRKLLSGTKFLYEVEDATETAAAA